MATTPRCFRVSVTTDPGALASPSPSASQDLADLLRIALTNATPRSATSSSPTFKAECSELAPLRQDLAPPAGAQGLEATIPRTLVTERQDPAHRPHPARGNFLIETGDLVEPPFPLTSPRRQTTPSPGA